MKELGILKFIFVSIFFVPFLACAQMEQEPQLVWENNLIDLGAVMEENGTVTSEFFFVNKADFPIYIEEIITDCGCTTASYTTDTLVQDRIGSVKINYEPTPRAGTFSKMIIVKTNIDSDGDSLFMEGYNIPYPSDVQQHYSHVVGDLGFYNGTINVGDVFTNEPKVKYVDFYNFKNYPLIINLVKTQFPDHVQARFQPTVIPAKSRGILELTLDGLKKNDLGFFEEEIEIFLATKGDPPIPLQLIGNIHEHFDPVPLSQLDSIPKLTLSELEVNLNKINAHVPISKIITLTNEGSQPLNIRKVISNCECLSFSLEKSDLGTGEKGDLIFTFDPKGRRGIDHKTLTIFSNDPLNPTKTVLIKSRIQ